MQVLTTTNSSFTRVSDVVIPDIFNRRFFTGKQELDNLFGGSGFVPGFTFTLAAQAGTGKTTLCLQTLELLELAGKRTAYISGEETQTQLAFTSNRINVSRVPIANMTDVDQICQSIVENSFDFVIIDSLPAITVTHKMNSKQKEEYIVTKLINTAKQNNVCIGVVLHFTKTGTYKGGTILPHSCDANFVMVRNTEDESLRDIESTKNRFGSTGTMTMEMSAKGFTFVPVENIKQTTNPDIKKTSKRDLIIEAISKGSITLAEIANETETSEVYVATLVRELIQQGMVTKTGKGSSAIFSSNNK